MITNLQIHGVDFDANDVQSVTLQGNNPPGIVFRNRLLPRLDGFAPNGNPPRVVFQTNQIARHLDFDGDAVTAMFPNVRRPRTGRHVPRPYCNVDPVCIKLDDVRTIADAVEARHKNETSFYADYMDAARLCVELPPYTLEFYCRVLRAWQSRNDSVVPAKIPKLYELCMLGIGRVAKTSDIIPRRYSRPTLNHIIQRVLRRMLDRCEEAVVYEAWPGAEFTQYPGSSECRNEIDLWLNRTRYLKQQRCPIERIKDYIVTVPDFERLLPYEDLNDYQVRVHQHNYFRCKCPPPPITILNRRPIVKPDVSKVSKQLRAAQRAERRAKRR